MSLSLTITVVQNLPNVISAAQAWQYGLSRHAVRHRLERGRWQTLLRGIYLTHSGVPADRDWARAAVLLSGDHRAMISGAAGLRFHGLAGLHPGPGLLVLVPNNCSRVSVGPVTVRHTTTMPRFMTAHPRIRVALAARCAVDACIGASDLQAVRNTIAATVQSGRCFVEDIETELHNVAVRGSRLLRLALNEVLAGAASVAEAEVATMMREAGIHGFRQNADVFSATGEWLARADFYWDALKAILEIDSRRWHFDPESWQATLRRHNRLEMCGYSVLHCTPTQIRSDPQAFVGQIRAWLADRTRSIGT